MSEAVGIRQDPAMLRTSGYAREEGDFYETPAWCTEALLSVWTPRGEVWEPAAGAGAIRTVLVNKYIGCVCSDTSPKFDPCLERDFFSYDRALTPSIVTNPPYDQAARFVQHALRITRQDQGQVAMLMRNEFDSAGGRKPLFAAPPFAMKVVLTKRPVWFPDRERKAAPRHNFSWFVWDWRHEGPATLRYAP